VARPNKDGLDYFPVDTKFDDEINIILSKFGPKGVGILVIGWQIIYHNSYFLPWSERELFIYKSRFNAEIELINDVINECLEWGIFNKAIYDKYGVLTSKGIQKRFIEATLRRKEVTFIKQYLLIDFKNKSYESYFKKVKIINLIDVVADGKKPDEEPPKKPKKPPKKAELSKAQRDLFEKFWEVWPKKVSRGQAETTWLKINPDSEFADEIIEGVKRSIKGDSRFKEGFTPHASTWLNAKGWLDDFSGDKKKEEPSNKFINFEQRTDIDFDKIEKKMMEIVLEENGGD